MNKSKGSCFVFLLGLGLSVTQAIAQRGFQGEPPSAREVAYFDLSGYWVPIITEDWRFRMVTPPIGDFGGVPLNTEGQRLANAWNPEVDIAAGNECKAYGVGGIMRMPTRLRISWENNETLRIDSDAGRQRRLLYFQADNLPSNRSLQGSSLTSWEKQQQSSGFNPFAATEGPGTLVVETDNVMEGYLRKNGIPYSEEATIKEYFVRHDDFGYSWFTVTTIVEDPVYLSRSFITSTHFRKEPNGNNWNPSPCEITEPVSLSQ
tara:strand:- start:107722 stop:108507 length:786 start_codon:yes stop_codon:yes gene_type:complete